MKDFRTLLHTMALVLVVPAAAMAQAPAKASTSKPKPKVESQATLAREAKISLDVATATALKSVPGSKVKSHELERENGKLIYTFDLKTAGKAGIDEVNVDALTGETVGKVQHEAEPAPKKPPVKKP